MALSLGGLSVACNSICYRIKSLSFLITKFITWCIELDIVKVFVNFKVYVNIGEKCFLFQLKSSFLFQDIWFFFWNFDHVEEMA